MDDVYIMFQGTGREGSLATDTYLIDAAKQLGIDLQCDCSSPEPSNACAVKVMKGVALLSKPTKVEIEQLSASERKERQRLACQTKIERPGEIEVMTIKTDAADEKPKAEEQKARSKEYKKEFQEMPLDEKISSLVELEAIALGETLSYIINSPYEAFGKVMEAMAGLGRDLEDKDRESKVPEEHREKEGEPGSGSAGAKEFANGAKASGKASAKGKASARKPRKRAAKTKRAPKKRGRPADKKKEEGTGGQK